MSIEMDNPVTLWGKLDAAANWVAQMSIAKAVGDDERFNLAYLKASNLLFESQQIVEDKMPV